MAREVCQPSRAIWAPLLDLGAEEWTSLAPWREPRSFDRAPGHVVVEKQCDVRVDLQDAHSCGRDLGWPKGISKTGFLSGGRSGIALPRFSRRAVWRASSGCCATPSGIAFSRSTGRRRESMQTSRRCAGPQDAPLPSPPTVRHVELLEAGRARRRASCSCRRLVLVN